MSNEALTWAFKQTAPSPGAKFVLAAIADQVRSQDLDRCTPGMATLMTMTNQGQRSLTRHLAELVTLGLLTRERRNIGFQDRLTDVFILSLPAILASSATPVANMAANMASSEPVDSISGQIDCGQDGHIKEPIKKTTTTKETTSEIVPIRQDVERLCDRLAKWIEANGSLRPVVSDRWRDSARLMLDKDKRTEAQIARAIDWCQQDDFWRGNVLSMTTLREKYDRLRLAAQRAGPKTDVWTEAYNRDQQRNAQ